MAADFEIKVRVSATKDPTIDLVTKALAEISKADISLFDPEDQQFIGDVTDDLKALQKELADTAVKGATTFDTVADDIKKVGQNAEQTGGFLSKAFKFNETTQAIKNVTEQLDVLTKPFVALDTATQQLKTLGDEAAAMAPNLREAAISMSKDLPFAASEIQTAMFDALASGVKGGENGLKSFADTAAKLAVGGGSELSAATNLLAGNLNAYGKSAEDAAKFSDIFFNTVNYGVTSIPELSSQLSNVIPTAASLGIEIENVGASLAVMTSKGVPTAQATTKLNQLFLEIAKPAASLAPILEKAGVSLDSLAKDDLPVTLGKIQTALAATGKTAISAFSSSEASAAFNTLASDLGGFEQTFKDVRDTTGSAENAYTQMADSIETQTKQMLSSVQAFLIQGVDALGGGFVSVISSATQLAPTVTALAGLKEIIPSGLFENVGKSIKGVLLPALVQMGVVRSTSVATVAAETAADLTNATVKGVQAAATEGATVAQYSLNTAMLANPIFLAVAAIGLLVGAYLIFSDSTKDLGEATKDTNKALDDFQKSDATAQAADKQAKDLERLSGEYEKLKNSADPESQKRFGEVSKELATAVPEASDAMEHFDAVGKQSATTYEVNTKVVKAFADEQRKLAAEARNGALENLDTQAQALSDSYREALGQQKELREDKKKLQADLAGGQAVSQNLFTGQFSSVKADLRETNTELLEQQKKLAEARPEIEKLVDGYQEMGLSVSQVAERTGFTVDQVKEFKGALSGTLVTADALEKAIASMPAAQQEAVRKTALHAEAFKDAQAEVDKLNLKLANAKVGGDEALAKDLESQLSEAQKLASEKKVKLQADLDADGVKDALKAIPEAAKGTLIPLTATLDVVTDEKALQETQRKAGGILRELGDLQKQQSEAAAAGNASAYDAKILAAQTAFRTNLEAQATAVANNAQKAKELRAALLVATDPKEVERLKGEIVAMDGKTFDAAKQFTNTAEAGKKMGAVKGDVKDVATELGFSSKAAQGTADAVKAIGAETKKTIGGVQEMAKAFSDARTAANSALTALKADLVGLLAQIGAEQDAKVKQDLQVKYEAALTTARATAKGLIDGDKLIRQVEQAIGVTTLSAQEAEAKKRADDAKKRADERRKALTDAQQKEINDFERDEKDRIDKIQDANEREVKLAQLHVEVVSRTNGLLSKQKGADTAKLADDLREANDAVAVAVANAQKSRLALLQKSREEELDKELTLIKAQQILADETTIEGLRASGELKLREMDLTNEKTLNALIAQQPEFQAALASLFSGLDSGVFDQGEFDAELARLRVRMIKSNEIVHATEVGQQAERVKLVNETNDKIIVMADGEAAQLVEANRTYLDDLKDSLADGIKAWADYFQGVSSERRKELLQQDRDLALSREHLKEDLLKSTIDLSEFNDEMSKNFEESRKIITELGGDTRTFWEKVTGAAQASFVAMEKAQRAGLDRSQTDLTKTLDVQLGKIAETGKLSAADSDKIVKGLVKVGESAAGVLVSVWGQMAASGKATIGDFADAAIITTIDTIKTAIEGNVVAIVAAAFAIDPFLAVGAVAGILIVETLFSKWEADARSRIGAHGFHEGGHTGHGPEWGVAGVVHFQEVVIPKRIVEIPGNRQITDLLLSGRLPDDWIAEMAADMGFATMSDLNALYIDLTGTLRSGFDHLIEWTHDIPGAMKHGNDLTVFYETEALLHELRQGNEEIRGMRADLKEMKEKVVDRLDRLGYLGQSIHEKEIAVHKQIRDAIGKDPKDRNGSMSQLLREALEAAKKKNR